MRPRARRHPLWGMMAEFESPTALVAAARRTREAGYKRVEAYTPFPIEELTEALHHHQRDRLPLIVLIGGLVGGAGGFGLQYWVSVVAYPLNIGGRPLLSWPSFIPVTFEMTILFAAFCAVLGMLGLNGLPMPYHPVFNVERFSGVSRNRFFLAIQSNDPMFDQESTGAFLASLDAREVFEVER